MGATLVKRQSSMSVRGNPRVLKRAKADFCIGWSQDRLFGRDFLICSKCELKSSIMAFNLNG